MIQLRLSKKGITTPHPLNHRCDLGAPQTKINYIKSLANIEFARLLAFSVFCSGVVPSYSSHSQENGILHLFQKSLSVSNLFLRFFDTLGCIIVIQLLVFYTADYSNRSQLFQNHPEKNILTAALLR